MRLSITILATYATLVEAREARLKLSKIYDNLAIKFDCNTFKLIRYEVNSPFDALDVITEDFSCSHRDFVKSRKRKGGKSDVEQLKLSLQ